MRQPGSSNPDSQDEKAKGQATQCRGVRSGFLGKSAWFAAIGGGLALATLGALAVAKSGERQDGSEISVDSPAQKPLFPVIINQPQGTRTVATSVTNFHGQPVMVSCSSCHTTTKPNLENRHSQDLDEFHQGLQINHGNLSCLSCHNASDYETLRLADGRSLDFADSMTLCSQCHGPQRRDYDMGLHGGMNGHWDLTVGGRTRNTCVDCHDAHSPAFPAVLPVLPPHDRISVQGKADHHSSQNDPHP